MIMMIFCIEGKNTQQFTTLGTQIQNLFPKEYLSVKNRLKQIKNLKKHKISLGFHSN